MISRSSQSRVRRSSLVSHCANIAVSVETGIELQLNSLDLRLMSEEMKWGKYNEGHICKNQITRCLERRKVALVMHLQLL